MVFGSGNLTYAIPEADINQPRSGAVLTEVNPGLSFSASGGFAYSLSYDVSLSISMQASYTNKSTYVFRNSSGTYNEAQSAYTFCNCLFHSLVAYCFILISIEDA